MMANKGNSRHMKSLTAPKYYGVHRKESAYVAKPSPGRHSLSRSIPLVAFATKAGISASSHDASRMIKRREIHVNGKPVRDPSYPVGLSDTILVLPSKTSYSVGINELGKVSIIESGGATDRLCKVAQKYMTGGGSVMIRLHDGTVIKASKDIKVNDSVLLGNGSSVKKVLKLGEGCNCTVIDGVHVGAKGKVKEIHKGTATSRAYVTVEEDGGSFDTLVRNIMVVE
jgi:small subunit ribosomal protein S4e